MVAMAFCFVGYSTWEGRVLFLDDLYVKPPFRRQGLSSLFFTGLCRAALVAKCARVQWTALEWNSPAVTAYRGPHIAATELVGWQMYRLVRADIQRLAECGTVFNEN